MRKPCSADGQRIERKCVAGEIASGIAAYRQVSIQRIRWENWRLSPNLCLPNQRIFAEMLQYHHENAAHKYDGELGEDTYVRMIYRVGDKQAKLSGT